MKTQNVTPALKAALQSGTKTRKSNARTSAQKVSVNLQTPQIQSTQSLPSAPPANIPAIWNESSSFEPRKFEVPHADVKINVNSLDPLDQKQHFILLQMDIDGLKSKMRKIHKLLLKAQSPSQQEILTERLKEFEEELSTLEGNIPVELPKGMHFKTASKKLKGLKILREEMKKVLGLINNNYEMSEGRKIAAYDILNETNIKINMAILKYQLRLALMLFHGKSRIPRETMVTNAVTETLQGAKITASKLENEFNFRAERLGTLKTINNLHAEESVKLDHEGNLVRVFNADGFNLQVIIPKDKGEKVRIKQRIRTNGETNGWAWEEVSNDRFIKAFLNKLSAYTHSEREYMLLHESKSCLQYYAGFLKTADEARQAAEDRQAARIKEVHIPLKSFLSKANKEMIKEGLVNLPVFNKEIAGKNKDIKEVAQILGEALIAIETTTDYRKAEQLFLNAAHKIEEMSQKLLKYLPVKKRRIQQTFLRYRKQDTLERLDNIQKHVEVHKFQDALSDIKNLISLYLLQTPTQKGFSDLFHEISAIETRISSARRVHRNNKHGSLRQKVAEIISNLQRIAEDIKLAN